MSKTVLMPKSLTAESGAKSSLIGEFEQVVEMKCPDCEYEEAKDDCEICAGQVYYTELVPVEWTTIKAIYAKAVELFGNEVAP